MGYGPTPIPVIKRNLFSLTDYIHIFWSASACEQPSQPHSKAPYEQLSPIPRPCPAAYHHLQYSGIQVAWPMIRSRNWHMRVSMAYWNKLCSWSPSQSSVCSSLDLCHACLQAGGLHVNGKGIYCTLSRQCACAKILNGSWSSNLKTSVCTANDDKLGWAWEWGYRIGTIELSATWNSTSTWTL